jgi:hypothetical protein
MGTPIQQSIEIIDEMFLNEANGSNELELDANFNLFESFEEFTAEIISHYGGRLEHIFSDGVTGYSLVMIRNLYVLIEFEMRQNRSYDFTFRGFYFISSAEYYIFGETLHAVEAEPSGAIEEQ